MCMFIRMVFSDLSAKEELLTALPMKEQTRGEDIFQMFKNFEKTHLPVYKLVSITTDGAPAMVGRVNGFIAKCRQDDAFPDFLNYHCIIHQQALCAKMLNMKDHGCGNEDRLFYSSQISSKTVIQCTSGED
ncbi:hypothetical protein PRIEUP_LOCUS9 [Pristimantis euphronides]